MDNDVSRADDFEDEYISNIGGDRTLKDDSMMGDNRSDFNNSFADSNKKPVHKNQPKKKYDYE